MLVRVCGASLFMMLFLTSALSMMGPSGPRARRTCPAATGRNFLCVLAAKPRTTSSISGARHHSDKKREGH